MIRIPALSDPNYRKFVTGYGLSYTLYWVTLLAMGWWVWEMTQSATWVGIIFFCDLFPAVLVTPFAAALADRVDRFRMLRIVLWVTVATGLGLGITAALGVLTPPILALFAAIEGTAVGFSQPAFFGMINRLVTRENLSSAVAFNGTVIQSAFVLGPVLAGLVFSFGIGVAPLAFAANAIGTLVYLYFLSHVTLGPPPPRDTTEQTSAWDGVAALWTHPTVFASLCMIVCIAMLQRPLIGFMPAINGDFEIVAAELFTLLTASYMLGSVIATLRLATRTTDAGLATQSRWWMSAMLIVFTVFFTLLAMGISHPIFVIASLGLMGLAGGFVLTANIVVLQTHAPEHLRSRILGNSFMASRAVGAVAVIGIGFVADILSLTHAMLAIAALVGVMLIFLFKSARGS